jgi:hypothetical protein
LDKFSCAVVVEMLGGGGEQTLTLCDDTVRRTGVVIVDENIVSLLDATDAKSPRDIKASEKLDIFGDREGPCSLR